MKESVLYADERIDRVNENIELIQKKNGLTFGTDAFLLAAYMKGGRQKRAVELGTGTGIISLLCAARERFARIDAFEVQPDFAELAARNAAHNGLDGCVRVHCADVREVSAATLSREVDVVFANPPYMRTDSGERNRSDYKYIARHEVCGTVADFCAAAYRLLRHGGYFYCVFRPDRLSELIVAMESHRLALKSMTFVHAHTDAEPSMVLVRAIKGGAQGMTVTAPLILYRDAESREMSDEAKQIYETMRFDEPMKKGGES